MRGIVAILVGISLEAGMQAAPAPRDFSAGFTKLCELARIPDLTGAELGTVQLDSTRAPIIALLDFRDWGCSTVPRHWRVGDNPDGSARILWGGAWPVTLYPEGAANPSQLSGRWSPLPRELATRSAVKEAEKSCDPNAPGREMNDEDRGKWLLHAALFHAAGDRNTANRMATFLLPTDREHGERVIAKALDLAAELRYWLAIQRFVQTADKPAFVTDLQSIRACFARSWSGWAMVDCIIEDTQSPAQPASEVRALPHEDQELVADLVATSPRDFAPGLRGWLFLVPPGLEEDPDSPLARLLARGIDAIPLLLAMAEDTRQTRYLTTPRYDPAGTVREGVRQKLLAAAGESAAEEVPLEGSGSVEGIRGADPPDLPHPATVRSLALSILGQLLPQTPEYDWHRPGSWDIRCMLEPEDSLPQAREWHRMYSGLPRPEVAIRLLSVPAARATAAKYLLASPLAEDGYAVIEQAIPDLRQHELLEVVDALVEARGEKARPVIDRIIAQLRSRRGTARIVRKLNAIRTTAVGHKGTPQQFCQAVRDANRVNDWRDMQIIIRRSHWFGTRQALAGTLLTDAAAAETPDTRNPLLAALGLLTCHQDTPPDQQEAFRYTWERFAALPKPPRSAARPAEEPPPRLDLRLYGPAWRRVLPSAPPAHSIMGGDSPDNSLVLTFLHMYEPQLETSRHTPSELLEILPGTPEGLLCQRVQTVLEGGANPPWPTAATVPAERVASILDALAGLPANESRRQALDLPANEYLALLDELPVQEELARRLLLEPGWTLPVPQTVGNLSPAVRNAFAECSGQRISPKLGEKLLAVGKQLTTDGHSFVLSYHVGPGLRIDCQLASLDLDAKSGTSAAALLEHYSSWAERRGGIGLHADVFSADESRYCAVFVPRERPPKTNRQTAAGADATLRANREEDNDWDGDTDPTAFLQALNVPPDFVAVPRPSFWMRLVGLDEKVYRYLRQKVTNEQRQDRAEEGG